MDILERLQELFCSILESVMLFFRGKKHKKTRKRWSHLFLFPVVMVYFELVLRLFTGTGFFAHIIFPVLFGIAAGFFLAAITSFFSRKINRKITIVLLFFVGLIFVTECLIKRSFQFYLPLSGIMTAADDVAGGYLSEALRAILFGVPAIVLFFLPGVLYVIYGKKHMPARRYKLVNVGKIVGYSVTFMLVAVLFANIGDAGAKYKRQYKFDTATEYFGLMTGMRLDLKYSMLGNKSADSFLVEKEVEEVPDETVTPTPMPVIAYGENKMDIDLEQVSANTSNEEIQSLNQYVSTLTPSSKNKYTGLFEGKNLILICAEAFSDAVVDETLTPTLYRLVHNGFYFSEYYQPTWGGSTVTGEYSFITGLVPLHTDQSMLEVKHNNLYFTLGNQLQRLGYYSCAYHNGSYDYYSRQETHTNIGYDRYLGQGNGLEDIAGAWVDDPAMIDKTLETYIDQQPFSIYYMTLSGHCIYKADHERTKRNIDYVRSVVGDKYKDTTTYYLCYQMELEYALANLVEKLEEAGIADDTVICLTADHYPYGLANTETFGNSEDYVSDLYGYEVNHPWELDHNTCIIWSGCLENDEKDMACEIDTPTYSLDIVPTLSNLFGLEYDSRLLVGRDVFSDTEPLVVWNSYSWATVEGKYDSGEDLFYPNEGSVVDEAYVERMNNIVSNKISFSKKVVSTDYYRVLFGEDDH